MRGHPAVHAPPWEPIAELSSIVGSSSEPGPVDGTAFVVAVEETQEAACGGVKIDR